jgi:LacI family transcriptional regulator
MSGYQLDKRHWKHPGRSIAGPPVKRGIKQVAVLIDDADSFARGVLAGIGRYQRESDPPWALHILLRNRFELPPPFLRSWKGDGIIARVDSLEVESELKMLDLPVISVSGALKRPHYPTLTQDAHLAAKLAFDCFRDRGFRNFAFVGYDFQDWSMQRGWSFRDHLTRSGLELEQLLLPRDVAFSHKAEGAIGTWLLNLKRPLAVWAANDAMGFKVLNACLRVGIPVPETVAVLGVDDDTSIAELASPPLSSIKLNGSGAGYEAAQLLARWMASDVAPSGPLQAMPPLGIASRASTDVYAIDDHHVAQALSIINAGACSGISVEEVVSKIPASRRQLEKKFRALLNRTMLEEIWDVQLRHATSLLETTDLAVKDIAQRCGYNNLEYFVKLFKRLRGETPSELRFGERSSAKTLLSPMEEQGEYSLAPIS